MITKNLSEGFYTRIKVGFVEQVVQLSADPTQGDFPVPLHPTLTGERVPYLRSAPVRLGMGIVDIAYALAWSA